MKYLATALTILAIPAYAQSNCATRDDANSILSDMYGEAPLSTGYSDSGHLLEIWANGQTGTWTALIIMADGTACIVDQGQGFHAVNRPQGEEM